VGGIYNFIIPYMAKLPKIYHQQYVKKQLPAVAIMKGMIEGIQPDYLVEMEPGLSSSLNFPAARVVGVQDLIKRDDRGRSVYGIDMRTLCGDLWDKRFQFKLQKPPKVYIPRSKDPNYELLFACLFGDYGNKDAIADFGGHYHDALGGETKGFESEEFPDIYDHRITFPPRPHANLPGV
jgi:hypothetical protein